MSPTEQVDKDALTLTRAIGLAESGTGGKPNYNAVGKSGEHGAYQWMPGNYEAAAKEAGLNPADFSPESQDKVAYYQVKKYKDKGFQPWEIASLWNSGKPDNWQNHSGINAQGVQYDTPKYVSQVKQNYLSLSQGGTGLDSTKTPPPQEEEGYSLIPNVGKIGQEVQSNIGQRISDFSGGISTALQGGPNAAGHLVSGVLQAGGAVAGGLGDVVNAGLQLIPGVQAAEKALGQGVKSLTQTKTGQDVVGAYNEFAQTHPELAKDIGAGVNILSAIPLLRGLSVAKTAIGDATVSAFKNKLTTAAGDEIRGSLSPLSKATKSLTRAEARGLDPVGTITSDTKFMPKVVEGPNGYVYDSAPGYTALGSAIAKDEKALQELLATRTKPGAVVGVPLAEVRKQMVKDIAKEYEGSGGYKPAVKAVNDYLDSYEESIGGRKFITLNDLNAMKRDVREHVNFDSAGSNRLKLNMKWVSL